MNTNTTTRTEGQQPGPCITGSQALLESFLREGVDTLFGYPGGAIIPVYDALFDYRDRLRHILVRHEQGAVHAAQGYARVSGRVGVCLVTSGPGATNTVTGLADALMDSTPLVLVTGQVGSSLLGTDAFQETNFVGITQAVTKWNCQVKRTEDIPGAIAKAFYIARSGRPGPVVVDITKDAQCGTAPFRYERLTSIRSYVPAPAPAAECIAEAVRLIDAAQRPLLMAGQGVMLGNAEQELQAFLAQERHTGRLDPAGAVGRADLLAAVCRYAGHARQLRPQHPQPGVRPAHRRGDAFRRPRDGQPQMFRGERQGHPPGDRPRRNRQDRTRRRGRHRRCETNAPAAHPKDPLRRAQGLDRRVPRLRQSRIRGGRPQGDPPGRRPHPHGRGRRYRSACLRQRRGAGDRRRAAADVRGALFRVPPQPQPGNFGRSRHDGLRASGRHRRQTGRPRPRGRASSRATAGCR